MQRIIDCAGYKTKEDAYDAGVAQAKAALAAVSGPIFLVDEMLDDELAMSNAMGWNSVWASDENKRRFDDLKKSQ